MALLDEFYKLFADISVVFAGFAGVVGAFSRFRVVGEAIAYRVRVLVMVSLTTLVASILPPSFIALGISEVTAIRISALIVATLMTAIAAWAWLQMRPLQRAGLLHTKFVTAIVYSISIPVIICYFVIAAGGMAAGATKVYFIGLLLGLFISCWYFLLLMFAVEIGKRK